MNLNREKLETATVLCSRQDAGSGAGAGVQTEGHVGARA